MGQAADESLRPACWLGRRQMLLGLRLRGSDQFIWIAETIAVHDLLLGRTSLPHLVDMRRYSSMDLVPRGPGLSGGYLGIHEPLPVCYNLRVWGRRRIGH